MPSRTPNRFPAASFFVFAGLIGACLSSSAIAAPPVVYHSPSGNGSNPGWPHPLTGPTDTLELYLSPGPAATPGGQEICLDGTGDEICGFTLRIESTGGLTLDALTPDVTNDILVHQNSPTSWTLNRINGLTGDSAPVRLGSLAVGVSGATGEVRVGLGSEAVGAALQNVSVLDNGPIAAPEPRLAWLLSFGTVALFLLAAPAMPKGEAFVKRGARSR